MLDEAESSLRDHYVATADIFGLWGYRNVNIKLSPETNFLIGGNGCGKTTIINLISYAITGNFDALIKLPFKSARITFRKRGSGTRKALVLTRDIDPENGVVRALEVSFYDRASQKEPTTTQRLGYLYLRGRTRVGGGGLAGLTAAPYGQRLEATDPAFSKQLADLCELTWLSVHRKSESTEEDSTRSYDSSVDQRIDEISNRFNQYVTEIDTLVKREGREFEKKLFSSIITDPKQENITDKALRNINLDQQKRAMSFVFEDLGFDESAYEDRLERHYDLAATARAKHTDKKDIGVRDFVTISSLFQAEQTINFWLEYRKKVSDHNKGRTNIINMLQAYFKDKDPFITDEGRVFFLVKGPSSLVGKSNRGISVISPFQLSSGEKQLYIFLMEALLEKNKTVVYIADEPELSMHIKWQESLVSSLKSLNPNAQFIFATHSPDIISSFTSSVINLEASIQ